VIAKGQLELKILIYWASSHPDYTVMLKQQMLPEIAKVAIET
jgi:hypothetical protein